MDRGEPAFTPPISRGMIGRGAGNVKRPLDRMPGFVIDICIPEGVNRGSVGPTVAGWSSFAGLEVRWQLSEN